MQMHLRVTFPNHEEEQRFAVYYHAQVWLLPIITGAFASLMWLCVALSVIAAAGNHPEAKLFHVSMIPAAASCYVAVAVTRVIWCHPFLAVNEALTGYLFCLSLGAAVCIFILTGPDVTILSPVNIYAFHGWLLVFLDSRLVSCLPLQSVNLLVAAGLQKLFYTTSAFNFVLALPMIMVGSVAPIAIKLLLEGFYRQQYMRHVQVHNADMTVWSELQRIIDRFPGQPVD